MVDNYNVLNSVRREIARLKQRPPESDYFLPDSNLQRLHQGLAKSHKLNEAPGAKLRRWIPKIFWPFFRNQGSLNRVYWDSLKALADEIDLLRLEIARLHESCLTNNIHISEHQAHLSDLNEAKEQQKKISVDLQKKTNPLEGMEAGHFYLDFENNFRGEAGLVSERQRNYIPFVDEMSEALVSQLRFKTKSDVAILDVGCGRGEWLQILKNNGYTSAIGVEINPVMVDRCVSKGVKIVHMEGLAYLKGLQRESVGLVTAFHLVEHLPFSLLADFFKESLRVLKPGGMLIIETPNPENLRVGAFAFYYDPTHRHPLPCRTLKFLAEWVGFGESRELYLNPYSLFAVLGIETSVPLPPEMGTWGLCTFDEKMKSMIEPSVSDDEKIVILVDLTPLRSDGSNGGLKTAALSFLRGLAKSKHPFSFVFLTSASSHPEVRAFAGPYDLVLCVREDEPWVGMRDPSFTREYFLPQPPPDLPKYLGVDLCYAPFGALFYFSPEIPTIALIADLLHEDWPYGLADSEREERRRYISFTCANSSMIQCISRTGMENIQKHYGVPAEKLFYTYLPPRLSVGDSSPEKGEKPYFLFPANFWLHKNHDLLLIAYNIYRHRHGEAAWDLVLTGHPDRGMEKMREFAFLLGLEKNVSFRGYVNPREMENLYHNAGALVFLSMHEGFGIPLLEAWHYGKPVISSDAFSLPEVGGESCFYADPRNPQSISDSLSALSENPLLAEELSRKGRQRLKLFDFDSEVEQLIQKILFFAQASWKREKNRRVPLLELPTPASDQLWKFRFKAGKRENLPGFSVFFGDCSLGSHSLTTDRDLYLKFRPEGRRLRIFVGEGKQMPADDLFSKIQASAEDGTVFELFQARL